MALGLRKQMLITLRDEKLIHFQNTVAHARTWQSNVKKKQFEKTRRRKEEEYEVEEEEREVQTRAPQLEKEVPGNDACLKEGRG